MRRLRTWSFAVLAVGGVLLFFGAVHTGGEGRSSQNILPGSRCMIHAGDFSSLQDALDSVPPEGGMVLESTSNVAIAGNLFSSVKPKAVEAKGAKNKHILFSGNVLKDVESDHHKLKESLTGGNLHVDNGAE